MIATFKKFMPLSIAVKMLLAGIVTALGGSGYIGFLSEYATYFYAWNNDFRLPAEGSPYLKITISSLTFVVILGSFLLFIGLYVTLEIFRALKSRMEKIENQFLNDALDKYKNHKAFMFFYHILKVQKIHDIKIIFFFGLLSFLVLFAALSIKDFESNTFLLRLVISLAASIVYMIILFPFIFPKYSVPISLTFTLIFLLGSPFTLFNQSIYSKILQEIGYGGGIKTVILQGNVKKEYNLLLRTNDSLFIREINGGQSQNAIEIPLNQINAINYLPKNNP